MYVEKDFKKDQNPGANQHLEGEFLTGDINLEVIIREMVFEVISLWGKSRELQFAMLI